MVWSQETKLQGGRFQIDRALGWGSYGITYLAQNAEGQPVVIKTPKDEVWQLPEGDPIRQRCMKYFDREAKILGVCRHQQIVSLETFFHLPEEGNRPCLVLEHIPGQDLWQRVRFGNCAIPQKDALRYIDQIGNAVALMHQKGFLHYDIKPQNIMLRDQDAVLIDFSLAQEYKIGAGMVGAVALES